MVMRVGGSEVRAGKEVDEFNVDCPVVEEFEETTTDLGGGSGEATADFYRRR